MTDKGSKFYYSRLSNGEKNIYDKMCGALLRFEPALSLHAGMGKAFSIDTHKIIEAVLFDNPVFFYVNRNRIVVKQTPLYIQFNFQYTHEKEEAEQLWMQVEEKIANFIQHNIKPEMSPLAKQIAIHRHMGLISASRPPYDKEDFSVIGALIKGRCVCEGYAKAYKLFCDRLGIASIVVLGDGIKPDGTKEPHAWNITRINGVTAHTDACWDAQFGVSSYDYFNLCDADIAADHSFDNMIYPKCDPNKINYFYKNGLIAADEEQLHEIIAKVFDKPYFSVKLLFPFSAEKARHLPLDIGEIRYNAAQNILSYSKAMVE
ncbi:MAG: hypothetical protein IJO64_02630 [Clostridia bacterium]|nr:hypothetical protein [Clostridia bacterium]